MRNNSDASRGLIDWYRSPVPRDKLRELTAKNNLRGAAQTVVYLALIVLSGTLCVLAVQTWHPGNARVAASGASWAGIRIAVIVLLLLAHGTFCSFMVNGFHELVHGTVFKSKRLNSAFLYVLSFLGWLNPFFFKGSHTRHHIYTLHPPADREVLVPFDYSLADYLSAFIVNPIGLFRILRGTARNAFGRFNHDWERDLFPPEDAEGRRRLFGWARLLVVGHAAVVVIGIVSGLWMIPVVITLSQFYGAWLQPLCNQSQHIGLPDNVPDYRLCCRTILLNPVLRFLYWHMNYHTEHHMYAAVPCYNLKKLHELIKDDLPAPTRGVVATWREISAILKTQRKDPSYRYKVTLPEQSG